MRKETKNDVKRAVLGVMAKALGNMNDIYVEGWPPVCPTILHQPQRPMSAKADK